MGTIKATTIQHESASSGIDLDASGNATLSADFTVDTDTLKVDATNDRVGINVASPTQALDVSGTVKATAFSGDGSSLTGIVSHGTWTPTPANNGSITVTVGNAGYVRIGNLVRIFFDFTMDAVVPGGGHAKFSGLPFNASNASAYGGSQFKQFLCLATGYSATRYWGIASATELGMYNFDATTTEQSWNNFDGTARTMYINGFYYTTDA